VIIPRDGVLCEEVARALVTALSLPDDTVHTRGMNTISLRERAKSGLLTHVLALTCLLAESLRFESSPSLGLGSVPFILEMLGGRLESRRVCQHRGIVVPQDVEESEDSLLYVPCAHALPPALEDAVKRTRRRRLRFPQQLLEISPSSGRGNMGPNTHQTLKDTQGDFAVCGQDDLALAREKRQGGGGERRNFGHG